MSEQVPTEDEIVALIEEADMFRSKLAAFHNRLATGGKPEEHGPCSWVSTTLYPAGQIKENLVAALKLYQENTGY